MPADEHDVASDGERGGATSVELALLWGALLIAILAVVQVALISYARQVALTAAQDGLSSGRAYATQGVAGVARRDTESFLARAGGTVLTDIAVTATVEDMPGLLHVRVTGTVLSLVPGMPFTVAQEAVGGLERITP